MPAVQPAPIGSVRHHVWGSLELSSGDRSRGSDQSSSNGSSLTPRDPRHDVKKDTRGSSKSERRDGSSMKSREGDPALATACPVQASGTLRMKGRHKAVVEEMNAVCFHSSSGSASSGTSRSAPPRTMTNWEQADSSQGLGVYVASIGSLLHGTGTCRPCHYVNTKAGCSSGEKCEFCHYPHNRRNRPRPCKDKRDRYKKLIAALDNQYAEDPHEAAQAAKGLAARSPFLKSKLRDKLQHVLTVKEEASDHYDQQPAGPPKQRQLSLQTLLPSSPPEQSQQQPYWPQQAQQAPPFAATAGPRPRAQPPGQGATSLSSSGYNYNIPSGPRQGILSL